MTSRSFICAYCQHLNRDENATGPLNCTAFPQGIPIAIWENRIDHRLPVLGDHGITFEPISPRGADYAAEIFGPVRVAEPLAA